MGKAKTADMGAVNAQADANAAKQQGFNAQNAQTQAAYNRPDQTNAFGNSVNWVQTGTDANGNPTFSQNQSLGATGQQYATGLTGLGQQYFNTAGAGAPDSDAAYQRAEAAATSRLDRERDIGVDRIDNKLKNQGLVPGTEAYDNAMRSTLNSYGDRRDSIVTGLQNQYFTQGLANRQQQINELMPGINFSQYALNTGQAGYTPINIGNVDYGNLQGTAFGQQNAITQQQNQYNQAMLGGLAGLGGAFLGGPFGMSAYKYMFPGTASPMGGSSAGGGP